jgi:hypothetical protein
MKKKNRIVSHFELLFPCRQLPWHIEIATLSALLIGVRESRLVCAGREIYPILSSRLARRAYTARIRAIGKRKRCTALSGLSLPGKRLLNKVVLLYATRENRSTKNATLLRLSLMDCSVPA